MLIPTVKTTISVPDKVMFAVIRNVGSNKIAFNFNSDSATDYWTLDISPPNDTSPVLNLRDTNQLHFKAIGANSRIEIIGWG